MSISSIDGSDENGYRFTTTRSIGSMPYCSRSARCSGSSRSARMPPWTFGWRVTTRCPRMAGNPVRSAVSVTARSASRRAAAVPPLDSNSTPSSCRARAKLDDAGLVVDAEQSLHGCTFPVSSIRLIVAGYSRRSTVFIRSCSVSSVSPGSTRTASWARIGPASTSRVDDVDGDARDLHPGGERIAHRMPAREGRQQRRVGVDDATFVDVEHRLVEDRAEAGHHHEVDMVRLEHVDDLVRVGETVEVLAEAGPLDEHGRHAVGRRDLGGAARSIDHDDGHRDALGEDGFEDRARPRCQDSDPHGGTLSRSPPPLVRYGTRTFVQDIPLRRRRELG